MTPARPPRFPLPAWTVERAWAAEWLSTAGLDGCWMLNVGAGWPTKVWPEERQIAFAAACRGEKPLTLTLSDALEATRIGLAITRSLASGMPESV